MQRSFFNGHPMRPTLITGGNGQIACALAQHKLPTSKLILLPRETLDITNYAAVSDAINTYAPRWIINTAAYTAVDRAEDEPELANLINHQGAANIAEIARTGNIPLLHLSTDYVFDGDQRNPYSEDDPVNPRNQYGKSKWLGEIAVRKYCPQHIILRISGVFSEHGNNFFKTMLKLKTNNQPISVVADQITCPTYANDIANVIFNIIQQCSEKKSVPWGTYHYCNTPIVSWHQFAMAILQCEISPITTAETNRKASRPVNACLDCSKILTNFGIQQADWREAIAVLL